MAKRFAEPEARPAGAFPALPSIRNPWMPVQPKGQAIVMMPPRVMPTVQSLTRLGVT